MKHLAALSFVALTASAQAQLTITDSLTVGSIAQLLEGFNVTVANVQVNCAGAAMGHFTGTSELAITEGLVLTSGSADAVSGPAFNMASTFVGTPGDADLELSLGMGMGLSYDACALEFDCIPLGDTLLFNFSFGSEEYPEFVNSNFNDVFAIYLTGPGFPMATNVAALPDGTPVAINNVNAGLNAAYFHDNEDPPGQYVSYDGFTTNLTAFAVVSPEETYHFKVVVSDIADGVFDTGVFLEAFSFRSTLLTTGIADNGAGLRIAQQGDQLVVSSTAQLPQAELRILNSAGAVVQRARISSDRTVVDLAGLGAGVYTAQVLGANGSSPLRFVVY